MISDSHDIDMRMVDSLQELVAELEILKKQSYSVCYCGENYTCIILKYCVYYYLCTVGREGWMRPRGSRKLEFDN